MNPYLQILRPSVCALSIIVLIAASIVAGTLFNLLIIPALIAVFLITAAGNVINDYFDYKIDKINAPSRPIPSGHITRKTALRYYVILSLVGLAFSLLVGIMFFAIALFNVIVSGFYASSLKKTALLGNAAVSWLAASIFLASGLISQNISTTILFLFLISFLGTMAREIIKDIEDIKGDLAEHAHTLPIIIGEARSRFVASIFMLLAIISLVLPILFNTLSLWYLPFALIGALLSVSALFMHVHKTQKIIKIAMYIITLGFIFGSLL